MTADKPIEVTILTLSGKKIEKCCIANCPHYSRYRREYEGAFNVHWYCACCFERATTDDKQRVEMPEAYDYDCRKEDR